MNIEQRRTKLAEIRDNESCVTSTGIPLRYRGETRYERVYQIPLEFLVYNKYNGRISSRVKAYERQNHELNAEDDADCAIIEDMLWKSKEDRNKKTMKDLVENGQIRHGIVTTDGVIIDGNRRASLLSCAYRERNKHGWSAQNAERCLYFNSIILPEDATPRDIQQLETTYQMGEDDKLDYNPIEKYLKCQDLKEVGFDEKQIAEMMDEFVADIRKWLRTLELMDDYLNYREYQDMYPMLDHVEDYFLSLSKGLRDWSEQSSLAKSEWEYTDTDIDDLETHLV